MMTYQEYVKFFAGFLIDDCAVRSRTAFSFVAVEHISDSDLGNKRLINYFIDKPAGKNLGASKYTGFAGVRLAVSSKPKGQAIIVSRNCAVGVLGAGEDAREEPIPYGRPDSPLYTTMHALATIDGLVYAVGGWRAVCRRVGKDQWESIVDRTSLPVPERNEFGSNDDGFHAIDGFAANDIYCGGGHSDLWRYDGKRWHRCNLPTNMVLHNICCGGDGYVYLGMQNGSVLRGRENSWSQIHKGELSIPFKDMVWYDNKIWCTSDYGTWLIDNGKFLQDDLPPEIKSCSGNLAVGDGVLLLAGRYGATMYDGQSWTSLIPSPDE
ncbi:hypothetical protein HF313_25200 [Massilia atriviolacea]|uniref:Uncharacterized protein n=1 Tax=Massilia atriviolacea TaxID=2495579 RepID=A0A430HNG9_9BURK|nr:hypothetical protein [Massilia atriviolacea]RSZ59022.1 hypothetical protein EJB06_11880 [Massilia atriviolacea]